MAVFDGRIMLETAFIIIGGTLSIEYQLENTPEMPLHCRYPEPDEFKVDATHNCWVTYTRVGIHSKYAEHILRYKYRQGYRRTGEHPRVIISITNFMILANQSMPISVLFGAKYSSSEQRKSRIKLLFQHLLKLS